MMYYRSCQRARYFRFGASETHLAFGLPSARLDRLWRKGGPGDDFGEGLSARLVEEPSERPRRAGGSTPRPNARSREISANGESQRGYLAVQIDGRWADVSPAQHDRRPHHDLRLHGGEAERFERHLATRQSFGESRAVPPSGGPDI